VRSAFGLLITSAQVFTRRGYQERRHNRPARLYKRYPQLGCQYMAVRSALLA